MRITYKEWNPRGSSLNMVMSALEILNEYAEQGYDLSVRQLYYQFVSKDLIPNTEKSYKRLVKVISQARDAGLIDWDFIKDRGRSLHGFTQYEDGEAYVKQMADSYHCDLWEGQAKRVQVWVEKDALVNVIARACQPYDVDYFPCKGYMSASAIWEMGRLMAKSECRDWLVLHLGDHDPSGIDMTRDIDERLNLYAQTIDSQDYQTDPEIEVRRIALTMDQIEHYQPPPNPAKLTDTRAAEYVVQYGDESWELDALEPPVIVELIQDHIQAAIDDDKAFGRRHVFQDKERRRLSKIELS